MKYLIQQTEYFYDGHGEEQAGQVDWFIVDEGEEEGYELTDPGTRYNCELEEDDELYEQDGYHKTAYGYKVKALTKPIDIELAEDNISEINIRKNRLAQLLYDKDA